MKENHYLGARLTLLAWNLESIVMIVMLCHDGHDSFQWWSSQGKKIGRILQNGVKALCFAHMLPCILSECFQAHRQLIKVSWDYGYLSGQKCSQRSIVSAQSSCFNFKTISVTDFNSPGITNLCFSWPDYGYCYSLRQSKYLNGPDRSSWSIVLVRKITTDADYQKNSLTL